MEMEAEGSSGSSQSVHWFRSCLTARGEKEVSAELWTNSGSWMAGSSSRSYRETRGAGVGWSGVSAVC